MSIHQRLEQRLQAAFTPLYLQVENESHLHGGPPRDASRVRESHFRAVIVSEQFVGKTLIRQHQQVYGVLEEQMKQIHALALHTYTPEEWAIRQGAAPASPQCPKVG